MPKSIKTSPKETKTIAKRVETIAKRIKTILKDIKTLAKKIKTKPQNIKTYSKRIKTVPKGIKTWSKGIKTFPISIYGSIVMGLWNSSQTLLLGREGLKGKNIFIHPSLFKRGAGEEFEKRNDNLGLSRRYIGGFSIFFGNLKQLIPYPSLAKRRA